MSGSKTDGTTRKRVSKKVEKDDATRMMHQKVRTASGRKLSSKLWIERQINDPYVRKAKMKGYRSRAAFKLEDLDDKFSLIKPGSLVVDLGCAPGGWVQIALKRGADRVVGIDLLEVEPVTGSDLIQMDFMNPMAPDRIKSMLGGAPDLVMSDLAANTTGHRSTDHLKTVALVEAAAEFAMETLRPGGHFVTKVFQGGAEKTLLNTLKKNFQKVQHAKPESSRKGSPEIYLVALNFQP
jgi:23S rRNA (uridine2552-2'-O)-methyltransferase